MATVNDKGQIKSSYKYVYWHKGSQRWLARLPIALFGKQIPVGYFRNEKEAFEAICKEIAKRKSA